MSVFTPPADELVATDNLEDGFTPPADELVSSFTPPPDELITSVMPPVPVTGPFGLSPAPSAMQSFFDQIYPGANLDNTNAPAPPPATFTPQLDPADVMQMKYGTRSPQNETFEQFQQQFPDESHQFINQIAPQVKTADQAAQLGRYVADIYTPERPVHSVAGDVWEQGQRGPFEDTFDKLQKQNAERHQFDLK